MSEKRTDTCSGRAYKGSQFWLQTIVNDCSMKAEIDSVLQEELVWLSPLQKEQYREYRLNDNIILEKLGIDRAISDQVFSFWPKNQPIWDGLAVSSDGTKLYLVEAKAHLNEMYSQLRASNPDSIKSIRNAMHCLQKNSFPKGDYNAWEQEYYQLANRLTFLYVLREAAAAGHLAGICEVYLILLQFVDDHTYIPTDTDTWRKHLACVLQTMTGSCDLPDGVYALMYSVKPQGILK